MSLSKKESASELAKKMEMTKKSMFAPPPPSDSSISMTGIPQVLSKESIQHQKEYFEKYSKLIKMVLDEEIAAMKGHISQVNQHRHTNYLVNQGLTLIDLSASLSSNILKETSINFVKKSKNFNDDSEDNLLDIGKNKLEVGGMVVVTRMLNGKSVVGKHYDGTLVQKSKKSMMVSFLNPPDNVESSLWRIDQGANRITYDRMFNALKWITEKNSNEVSQLKEIIVSPSTNQNLEKLASAPPTCFLRKFEKKFLPKDYSEWNLNDSQKKTIETVLNRRLSLVQGPPGTGKTHTAVHLVKCLLQLFQTKGIVPNRYTILCAADTNVAVDNLLEGLSNAGVKCLRVGRPAKIREELLDRSVEQQVLNHHLMRFPPSDSGEYFRLQQRITREILIKTEVICATCVGSSHQLLDNFRFPIVIVDESTQATEPATLCSLVKGSEMGILLGDHFQLPPTVTSQKASLGGLSESLFQRLVNGGVVPLMLQIQYRMHPTISEFSNLQFYHGKICNGKAESNESFPAGFEWPSKDHPVAFVSTNFKEHASQRGMNPTKANNEEARWVLKTVDQLLEAGTTIKDIGILSPYAGQVELIKSLLEKNGGTKEGRKYHRLSVHTVDGFQGREKEIIIFSTVRGNDKGRVGFLGDWRRLNVAITRARRALIVIGNEETLKSDPVWAKWVEWAHEKGIVIEEKGNETNEVESNGELSNGKKRKATFARKQSKPMPKKGANTNRREGRGTDPTSSDCTKRSRGRE